MFRYIALLILIAGFASTADAQVYVGRGGVHVGGYYGGGVHVGGRYGVRVGGPYRYGPYGYGVRYAAPYPMIYAAPVYAPPAYYSAPYYVP